MTTFYVTDGRYNYFQTHDEREANEWIVNEEKKVRELERFYMDKYGYIPENVDIPKGYYLTTNRFN